MKELDLKTSSHTRLGAAAASVRRHLLIHNTQSHDCVVPLPRYICTVLTVMINNVPISLFWPFTKATMFLSLHYTELGLGGWAVPVKLCRATTKMGVTRVNVSVKILAFRSGFTRNKYQCDPDTYINYLFLKFV